MAELVTLLTAAALILMVLALVGSFAPLMPGTLLSVIGILVYWHGTGYTEPGTIFLIAFITVGLIGTLADWFSGVVAAKAGGASNRTGLLAGIAGFLLFFLLGPIGILFGVAGTVLLREFLRTDDLRGSIKASIYSSVGVLGSGIIQFIISLSLLITFVIALLL